MAIKYTYEIKTVDSENEYMEIEYTAPNKDPILVGAPLPLVTDDIVEYIDRYAPYLHWVKIDSPVFIPEVGHVGTIDQSEEEAIMQSSLNDLPSAKSAKIYEIDQWKREKRDSFIVIDGFVLKPNQRYLSNLKAAKSLIESGDRATVNYKFGNDVYQAVDGSILDSLISKLTVAIQDLFDDEKAKIDEVNEMTDIDAVIAYSPSFGSSIPTA